MSTSINLIQSTISFLLLLVVVTAMAAAQQCPSNTLDVHFPFGIQTPENDQYLNYTYPGFNLSCQSKSNSTLLHLPTLHLPNAGNFTVLSINYLYQQLYISDPNDCLPSRMSRFNLSSSPFRTVSQLQTFVFFSCQPDKVRSGFRTVTCLGSDNLTVIGLPEGSEGNAPEGCAEMERVLVPTGWVDDGFRSGGVWLQWDWPDCRACDGLCGFRGSATQLEVGCSDVPTDDGLSKTVNYALGFGILGFLCIIALLCCARCKKKFDTPHGHHHHHHHQTALELSTAVAPQPRVVHEGRRINQPHIGSYPKTMIGQSKRLATLNGDGTCPICLCEYRIKKALKTLPECNHYFHAHCIDAWLKLNSTCPVCRADTPDRSASSSQSRRFIR